MKPDELKAIRDRAEKATPGPWRRDVDCFDEDGEIEATVHDEKIDLLATIATDVQMGPGCWEKAKATQAYVNAAFIAHARSDIPALLERVRVLEEAAKIRLNRGCNDTCSHSLNPKYECDCGDAALARALSPERMPSDG